MLVSYSQQSSLEQAIIETFGGGRPCEICKFIQTKDTESAPISEQKASESQSFKLLLGQVANVFIMQVYYKASHCLISEKFWPFLMHEVPIPPPRYLI